VLLPIIFEQNKRKKYLVLTISYILCFIIVELYFFISIIKLKTNPNQNIFGIDPSALLTIRQIMNIVDAVFIPLVFIGILTFFYVLYVYGYKRMPSYFEPFVHVIFVMLFYTIFITAPQAHVKEFMILSCMFGIFYFHAFILIPKFLFNKKIFAYMLGVLFVMFFYYLIVYLYCKFYLKPKFYPENGERLNSPAELINSFYFYVLLVSLFVSFIYAYVRNKVKSDEKIFNLKLKSKESELKLLKSQVNPHFLFNTLNNLYSTALDEKATRTSQSIAKLGSLIRYMQDDINKEYIPLKNEIKYMNDYIVIQKLRCAIEPKVELIEQGVESQIISPGLLIPFVENAFKYGIDPTNESNLRIKIDCNDNNLRFECYNSYNEEFREHNNGKGFGIGIKNAKQRLELVYPNKFKLDIVNQNNEFIVSLQIKLK
jgi:hypothetical protein